MWGYIQGTNLLHKDSIKTKMPLSVQNPKLTSNFSCLKHWISSLNIFIEQWRVKFIILTSCAKMVLGASLSSKLLKNTQRKWSQQGISCGYAPILPQWPKTFRTTINPYKPGVCSYRIHDVLFKPPTSLKNNIFLLYGVEFIFSTIY